MAALVPVLLVCLMSAAHAQQGTEEGAVWRQLDLVGADAKLPMQATWHDAHTGWAPAVAIGGGAMWFEGNVDIDTAPYGQISFTWPRALGQRVGLEIFTNYARARLDCTETVTDIVFVPDPGFPSEDPGYEPPPGGTRDDIPYSGKRLTTGEGSSGEGVMPVERRRRRNHTDHGNIWQIGVGVVPRFVQTDIGGTPLTLAGRLGVSVTVLDFDCESDTAPGAYAGLVLEVHPTERVSVGIDAMIHAVDADFAGADRFLSATAGARIGIAF